MQRIAAQLCSNRKNVFKNVLAAILSSNFSLLRDCPAANWFLDISQDNCRFEMRKILIWEAEGRTEDAADYCSAQSEKLKLEFLEKIWIFSIDLGRVRKTFDNCLKETKNYFTTRKVHF